MNQDDAPELEIPEGAPKAIWSFGLFAAYSALSFYIPLHWTHLNPWAYLLIMPGIFIAAAMAQMHYHLRVANFAEKHRLETRFSGNQFGNGSFFRGYEATDKIPPTKHDDDGSSLN